MIEYHCSRLTDLTWSFMFREKECRWVLHRLLFYFWGWCWDSAFGTSATNWPYCNSPGWWMSAKHLVGWVMQLKPKFSEQTCPHCCFAYYKSHMTWRGIKPGLPRWEASDRATELYHGFYGVLQASISCSQFLASKMRHKLRLADPHLNQRIILRFPQHRDKVLWHITQYIWPRKLLVFRRSLIPSSLQ
jgi:hypothetical protein